MTIDTEMEKKMLSLIAAAVPGKFKRVKITRHTQLQKELGLNSLGLLALVFHCEETFGVVIERSDLKIDIGSVKTVGDLFVVCGQVLERAHTSI